MKKVKLLSLAFVAAFALQSCNNGNKPEDSEKAAKEANEQKADNKTNAVDEGDAKWADEVANGGMKEVEASQKALTMSMDKDVKSFAQMMVDDHTKANNELKDLAAKKNITLPSSLSDDARKDIDDMSKKTGHDFDEAYMDMMVSDHDKTVSKLQDGNNSLKDADLKAWAAKTLPVVQHHDEMAKSMKDMVKKEKKKK